MAGSMKSLYGDTVTNFERFSVRRNFGDSITALASDDWKLAEVFQLEVCQHGFADIQRNIQTISSFPPA